MWLRLFDSASARRSCVWPKRSISCAIAHRLVHSVQVGALDVFNDRDFKHLGIAEVAQQHRQVMQLRHLRGTPAPLSGNDLVTA